MEALISPFDTGTIRRELPEDATLQGTLLWVWHADKIPPHIGISVYGKYYSIKVGGKDDGVPVESLISLLERRAIPTLCFALSGFRQSPQDVFGAFDKVVAGKGTCLEPIRSVLGIPEAEQLSELLNQLYLNERVEAVYGIHLPPDYEGIPAYSTGDIHAHLNKLAHEH